MNTPSKEIIAKASDMAVENNSIQVVGLINKKWSIADMEDEGRISEMTGETFRVDGAGLIEQI